VSRELRFRAWHAGNKFGEEAEMLFGTPADVFKWKAEGQPVTIEQFTGLTDKNGVDIYENDNVDIIARTAEGTTMKMSGVVEFEDFEYTVSTDDGFWPSISWKCIEQAKVIGHIHEDKS